MEFERMELEPVAFGPMEFERIELDLTALDLTALDLTALDLTALDLTALDLTALDLTALDLTALGSRAIVAPRQAFGSARFAQKRQNWRQTAAQTLTPSQAQGADRCGSSVEESCCPRVGANLRNARQSSRDSTGLRRSAG
jgi:hypothetical protein